MALTLDGSAATAGASGTSTTVTLTCSSAGNVIRVSATYNSGSSCQISSVTATGATFAYLYRRYATAGTQDGLEVWEGYASGTFNATITVTMSASTTYLTVHAYGVNGAPSSAWEDTNGGMPYNAGYPTSPCDPIAVTTANANDIILGHFREASTASPTEASSVCARSAAPPTTRTPTRPSSSARSWSAR